MHRWVYAIFNQLKALRQWWAVCDWRKEHQAIFCRIWNPPLSVAKVLLLLLLVHFTYIWCICMGVYSLTSARILHAWKWESLNELMTLCFDDEDNSAIRFNYCCLLIFFKVRIVYAEYRKWQQHVSFYQLKNQLRS